jgi:signal transduction histidine kinase
MKVNLFKQKDVPIAALMTAAIFAIDLATPFWYDAWVLYLLPLFLMFRSAKRPYIFSVIITILTIAGLLIAHPYTPFMNEWAFNRITGILGGWGVSVLLMRLRLLERQKEDFYAIVTHDIKSSLTTILGYTEFLQTDKKYKLNDEQQEIVAAIDRSGHNILRLAEGFLDLSRLRSWKMSLNKSAVDVGLLMKEIHGCYVQCAREKGLELKLELPEAHVVCMLDRRYVESAVRNLVENAIKYTRTGSVTLKAARQAGSGGEFVAISVSDTGPGIPREHVKKIFNRYYRSPRTAGLKGTGLGLAIVKEVADVHDGLVQVNCTEGAGCTFKLFLPYNAS